MKTQLKNLIYLFIISIFIVSCNNNIDGTNERKYLSIDDLKTKIIYIPSDMEIIDIVWYPQENYPQIKLQPRTSEKIDTFYIVYENRAVVIYIEEKNGSN
ncbi:MAG: hypothetical protein LBM96_06095 [Methanobrevibacter sp.]|jgi:hypothetical protein|nr:hypothetical protein [Candidatus Methanoflexus mossambicus]